MPWTPRLPAEPLPADPLPADPLAADPRPPTPGRRRLPARLPPRSPAASCRAGRDPQRADSAGAGATRRPGGASRGPAGRRGAGESAKAGRSPPVSGGRTELGSSRRSWCGSWVCLGPPGAADGASAEQRAILASGARGGPGGRDEGHGPFRFVRRGPAARCWMAGDKHLNGSLHVVPAADCRVGRSLMRQSVAGGKPESGERGAFARACGCAATGAAPLPSTRRPAQIAAKGADEDA